MTAKELDDMFSDIEQTAVEVEHMIKESRWRQGEVDQNQVTRRCPTEEGENMWGCHTDVADYLACITENNGDIYARLSMPLFAKWDAHMTQFAKSSGACSKQTVRLEGLGWLLTNGEAIFEAAKSEARNGDPDFPDPTPDETRAWFCWLYRQFKSWKIDQERQ